MEHTFRCKREMIGDKAYRTGDPRRMTALDAVQLVKRGALVPVGAEAIKAMDDILGNAPDNTGGIVQASPIERVKEDDYSNKAMGNAPANKGKGGRPAKAKPAATAPGATPDTSAPAVANIGVQGGVPQTPSPAATPGAPGGDVYPTEPAAPAGQTPPPAVPGEPVAPVDPVPPVDTTAPATPPAPVAPVPPRTGKRR